MALKPLPYGEEIMEQEYPGYCLGFYESELSECKNCLIKNECKMETGNNGNSIGNENGE